MRRRPLPSALVHGAKLAGSREHSRAGLARKLKQKGHATAEVESALDSLQEKGFINDERAAVGYISARVRAGYGPRRILVDLARHGIAGPLARAALAEHYPPEKQREILQAAAHHLLARVLARGRAPELAAATLARRGFLAADIVAVMKLEIDPSSDVENDAENEPEEMTSKVAEVVDFKEFARRSRR